MLGKRQIVFAPFCLDLADERLLRGKEEIRLHPKAFSVLRCLTENAGALVTKQNLMEAIWPGLHVTDAVLTVSIREVRKALGDKPKSPKFIETVHRRGYRFLPPVAAHAPRTNVANKQQDIRFCKTTDGVKIAYSTMGVGSPLVIPPQWVTHLEADLVEGPWADIYEALAQRHTVVRFDKRGTGLSDRNVYPSSEKLFIRDLEAVVDGLGLQRFASFGLSAGGELSLQYCARHPDRVSHLVFYGTNVTGASEEQKRWLAVALSVIRASWEVGSKLMVERFMPYGGTRQHIERLARWVRLSMTGEVAQRLIEQRQNRSDLRHLLDKVSAPTLVIHRRGDHVSFEGGREMASTIRGARFLPLDGYNHLPSSYEEAMELVTPVVEFLAEDRDKTGARHIDVNAPLTVLFTIIEASVSLAQRLEHNGSQRLVRIHNDMVHKAIESYNGKEIRHTGKNIVASFFSPSRAVGCAAHVHRSLVARNGAIPDEAIKFRIGLNAGEPMAGDNEFRGSWVRVAEQICKTAEFGQVLVSDVVRQLVAGKGFTFEPAGVKILKGFHEPVPLYKLHVQ